MKEGGYRRGKESKLVYRDALGGGGGGCEVLEFYNNFWGLGTE
jgi:hypothetical protein